MPKGINEKHPSSSHTLYLMLLALSNSSKRKLSNGKEALSYKPVTLFQVNSTQSMNRVNSLNKLKDNSKIITHNKTFNNSLSINPNILSINLRMKMMSTLRICNIQAD